MTVAGQTASDEVTPLLGGNSCSAIEPSSDVATTAGPSGQGSRAPNVKTKVNANAVSDPTKKTPLPWAQLSIILFLQLAEPLTSQVIYPVSSTLGVSSPRAQHPCFPSLHLRSVLIFCYICRTNKLTLGIKLIRSLKIAKNDAEVGYYVGVMVSY